MKTKRLFRLRNADLYDVDAIRVERMAKKGWLPASMSRSFITLEKGEPCDIKCRLLFYDTAEPSYNRRMTELQEQGWSYISSDGVSQTMLTAPADSEAPEITVRKNEEQVVKRHRFAQGIVAAICVGAAAMLSIYTLQNKGTIPLKDLLLYAAILAYGVQSIACCVSHTRNLVTISGEAGPRKSCAALYFHAALALLTGLVLVLAIVIRICYN